SQNAHVESLCAASNLRADAAQPEHAQDLAVELRAGELLLFPCTALHGGICLRDGAGGAKQMGERQFACSDGVAPRGIHDDHATFCCGVDIDIVNAHACATDCLQLMCGFDNLAGNLCRAAHDDRIHIAHELQYAL